MTLAGIEASRLKRDCFSRSPAFGPSTVSHRRLGTYLGTGVWSGGYFVASCASGAFDTTSGYWLGSLCWSAAPFRTPFVCSTSVSDHGLRRRSRRLAIKVGRVRAGSLSVAIVGFFGGIRSISFKRATSSYPSVGYSSDSYRQRESSFGSLCLELAPSMQVCAGNGGKRNEL